MTAGVLIGPSLTSFIASNAALIGPTLVTIPGGTFMMGAGTDYGAHQATISTFQMGRTPVTNDEYAKYIASLGNRRHALLGADPVTKVPAVIALGSSEDEVRGAAESAAGNTGDALVESGIGTLVDIVKSYLDSAKVVHIGDHNPPARFDRPRQPVVNVNWFEAAVYALLHGGLLPTEWQWEYAARVVPGREELRDYATPSGRLTHEEAHFYSRATADVDDARYPTLGNGLRHMTGNVWEWMQNRHGDYPRTEVADPTGPLEGDYKTLRGGSWRNSGPDFLRAAFRGDYVPVLWNNFIGFRVVSAPQDFNK